MWLLFIVACLLGIAIHEFAHFIVAKSVGCGVETFSIGFGKGLIKKKIGETTYQITPWLVGGYVQLKGELDVTRSKYALCNKRYFQKLAIVLAGVTANFILGGLLMLFGNTFWYDVGWLNVLLGLCNIIPFPALDGSYVFLFLLEKIYPKKKAYRAIRAFVNIGMILLNLLQLAMLVWLGIVWWPMIVKKVANIAHFFLFLLMRRH